MGRSNTPDGAWRSSLRRYLGEHLNEPLLLTDLFQRFGRDIPLHIATRSWVSGGRRTLDAPADQMRWNTFCHQVAKLSVDFDPILSPRQTPPAGTKVIARGQTCERCGAPFFGYAREAKGCSRTCAILIGKEREKHTHTIRRSISIEQITIEDHHRAADPEAVHQLAGSIRRLGLQTPIAVYDCDEGLFLVAGRHRVEAHIVLGRDEIDAHVFTDKREAELWSVSENLHRSELTALERSEALDRWRRLTTGKVTQLASPGQPRDEGIRATARALNVKQRDVQRAAKIAKLSPEAKAVARETGQDDNQAALLRAAQHEAPEDQIAALRDPHTKPRHKDVRASFCAWLDDLDPEELDALLDLDLDALVAERVADARRA